uniref:B box-type domain-containing protein n=1 Tax=Oryza punctata TaxID=4537 RepID=A0A0E0JFB4_ORYPU
MKVLCSACEAAEARVLCCADEAALCARCDLDVHAANRLAGKHHRLPLLSSSSSSSSPPNCDICQETHAYFFCVEDRALLCRTCDVAVHTANAFVSSHRRFLLTGVQVGLDNPTPTAHDDDDEHHHPHPLSSSSSPPRNTASSAPPMQQQPPPQPPCARKRSPSPLYSDDDVIDWATGGHDVSITANLPDWSLVDEQFTTTAPPVRQAAATAEPVMIKTAPKRASCGHVTAGTAAVLGNLAGLAGGSPDWPLDEFFGFADFNSGFAFAENGTSKADSGKLGSMDGSPNGGRSSSSSSSAAAATAAGQDFFGQVPEVHWTVPELPSPPTASGLHWQREPRYGGGGGATDAGAHHRLPLLSSSSSSSSPPNCDICQETHAYFFCVEDRALLCRTCDVAVHTANAFVSSHRRFLLTGVQVGLDNPTPTAHDDDDEHHHPHPLSSSSSPPRNTASSAPPMQQQPPPQPPCARKRSPSPLYSDDDVIDWATGGHDVSITANLPDWSLVDEQFTTTAPPVRQAAATAEPVMIKTAPKRASCGHVTAGTAAVLGNLAGLAGGSPDWPLDEFFGFADFNSGFAFAENGTSKADSGKLGSMDGSPNGGRSSSSSSSAAAATAAGQDFFGQVPEVHWTVPELPSPPTASGLHWQREPRYGGGGGATDAGAVFVPDISSPENPFRCFAAGAGDHTMKRRRRC